MASRRLLLCGVLVAWLSSAAWADDKTNELEDDSSESSCDHDPANAVLFPFVFLAIGAATLYLTSRYAPDVPYTVLMLCWGFLIDWWASIDDTCPINALQDSIYLWSNIDGDMVLLIFLPALLFGDAMSMVRGRGGDADTTESQRDMLDLTMTNAWSATTAASTHTRHRGTEELSEI